MSASRRVVLLILAICLGLPGQAPPREPVERFVLRKLQQAARAEGIELKAADIRWNLFILSAKLTDVTLASTAAPDLPPIAHIDSVSVNFSYPDLFAGDYTLKNANVVNPAVHVVMAPGGRDNIPKLPHRETKKPVKFLIEELHAAGASLRYEDRARQLDASLPAFNLDVHGDPLSRNQELRLKTSRPGSITYHGITAPIDNFSTDSTWGNDQLQVKSSNIIAAGSQANISGSVTNLSNPGLNLQFDSAIDLAPLLGLLGVTAELAGRITGRGVLRGPWKSAAIQAKVHGENVDAIGFQGLTADADAEYQLSKDRITVSSFDARSESLGRASGTADVALKDTAGRTTIRARLSGVNIEQVTRRFKAGIYPASRATGAATVWWPGTRAGEIEGDIRVTLVPSRSAPSENVLPAGGEVTAAIRGKRLTAGLAPLRALDAEVQGRVELESWERLGGRVQARADDTGSLLAQLARYLGRKQPLVDLRFAGPATAAVDLGGTVKNPAISASVHSPGLQVGTLRDVALEAQVAYADDALRINSSQVKWRRQAATTSGTVSFRKGDRAIAIRSHADNGDLQAVMKGLDLDLPVTGAFTADAAIGGTVDEPVIDATASGGGLRAFGETLGRFNGSARIAHSTLTLQQFNATQPAGGQVTVSGTYGFKDRAYSVNASARALQLLDVALPNGEPVSGTATFTASGAGTVDQPQLDARLDITGLQFRGRAMGEALATVKVQGQEARFDAKAPQFGLTASGTASTVKPYAAQFQARADNLDLALLPLDLPKPLSGAVTASVTGSGDLEHWRTGTAHAEIQSANARYGDVPVRIEGPATADYANERLALPRPMTIVSGKSRLSVEGSIPLENRNAPGSVTARGDVDVATIAGLIPAGTPVQAAGMVHVDAAVNGTLKAFEPRGTVSLAGGLLSFPDTPLPPFSNINFTLAVANGAATLQQFESGWGPATIAASAELPLGLLAPHVPFQITGARTGTAAFRGDLANIQLGVFGSLPEDLSGSAAVHVEGTASRLDLEGIDARATFPQLSLTLGSYTIQETGAADITLAKGALRIGRVEFKGPETDLVIAGTVPLAGAAPSIDLRLSGATDAALFFFFTRDIRARGPARVEVAATGPIQQPQLNGFLEIQNGQVTLETPRLIADDLHLRADLSGNRVNISTLKGGLNGGTLTGGGGFTIGSGGLSDFKINVKGESVYVEYPEGLRTVDDFNLSLLGVGRQYILDGEVDLREGSYTHTLYFQEELVRRLRGGGAASAEANKKSFVSQLRFNVRVKTIEPLAVQNNLAKAEVVMNLVLVGTTDRPGLTGRLEVLEGGQVYLGNRQFLVTRAAINFTNENRIEPLFDLLATTKVSGYELTLQLSGPIGDLTTNLTADDPTLTEPQVMALLLTGHVVDNAQAAESEGARQQVAALLAGSLTGRISQQFQQAFGLSQVRLEPDLISPEQNPTARLTVGQNLTRQLSLIYSMDLSNAGNQIWIAEYDITRRFMTQAIKQEDNSYRFEFRHDKRFGGTPFEPISRGPAQRRVGTVTFSGNTYFTPQQLQREFKVKTGQKYDYFHVRKGLDSLARLYAKQDLLETRIQVHRDQHGDRVDLDVHITPGPRVAFVFEGWEPPHATRDRIRNIWRQGVFEAQRSDEAGDAIQEALLREKYLKGTVNAAIQDLGPASRRVLFEIQPGVRYQSVKLVFDGAKAVESDDLAKVITKAKLENVVYTRPDEVSQALTNYYRDQGFLAAEVGKAALDLDNAARTAKIVIPIAEGPKYRVGKIAFNGNTVFKPSYLLDEIALTEGEAYTPELREQSYTRLQDLFWNKGYNDAEISYALQLRPRTGLVDVVFDIQQNKQRVVKSIEIGGNDYTSLNLIRTQLAFRAGDVLTNRRVSRSRVNLYLTGAYVLVDIATKDLPEEGSGLPPHQRPVAVTVTVHEVQPYQIRYGGFYDTDRGPGAIADFTTYNTLGAARSLGLRLRYDSQIKEARLYFAQPYLRRFPIRTNFVVYGQTDTTPAYKVDRVGVSLQEEARWRRRFILSFGYRFEHTVTRGASPDPLFPFAVTARIAPLTATLTRETRDDLLNPTRGSFLTQAIEYAPSWLGSQLRYARYYGQYYRYVPLQKPVDIPFASQKKPRLVYAGAVRVGLAHGFGGQDIIPSERFYAGGGTTIRGFKQDFAGPVIAGVPTGGEAELIINNELRFPLWKWFDGVTFLDIGNVYQRVQDFDITNLRKAGGLGLRLRTPYVLLRLDYGVKLDRRSGESFGQLFFSIGQAF